LVLPNGSVWKILFQRWKQRGGLDHAKVTGILKGGNTVSGVKVQDMLTGKEYEIKHAWS